MTIKKVTRPDTLTTALLHEILRCRDAYEAFAYHAGRLILGGKDKRLAYSAYNAYSYFLLQLFEFYSAIIETEIELPAGKKQRADRIDQILTEEAQRALNRRIHAIEGGYAPSWENDISYYQEPVPNSFGSDLRKHRNKTAGHASKDRITGYSLSQFYRRYHRIVMVLFYENHFTWLSHAEKEWPDLGEVTDFSVAIHKSNPAL